MLMQWKIHRQQATPDNIHTEECSILSAPRKGETWSDIVLESTFRSAVQNASVVNDTGTGTGTGTVVGIADMHLLVIVKLEYTIVTKIEYHK